MSIFDIMFQHGSIELHSVFDMPTGLRALVAIHDTRLGPAVGGTRMHAYASEEKAVHDVVRLSRAMTAKAALAGLRHGGGKAVIWLDENRPIVSREEFFRAYARFVHTLGGRYITTEDSGTSTADMDIIREITPHCLGASLAAGGSGDPSSFTALGVRRGIEACAKQILGKDDLTGLHIAIQGVGNVGAALAQELADAGCQLTIADVAQGTVARVARAHGATVVSVDDIFDVDCDIFAPCALGGAINDATIDRLRCKVVAGSANNQLASHEFGGLLHARGIFYAPDYAINAGGLINVAQEYSGYQAAPARDKTLAIRDTIAEIALRSEKTNTPPSEIADRMVEEILAGVSASGVSFPVGGGKPSTPHSELN